MKDTYSLRRRLLLVMSGAFALGLLSSIAYEYLEAVDVPLAGVYGDIVEILLPAIPFLAASVLIWLIVGWSVRELERSSRQAELVGPGNPEARLSESGLPSEVQPLVRAFNGALERLARAYEAERRLTADAAHALRTPLSVLSLRLQRAKSAGQLDWPTVEQDVAGMTRVVAQLVDLARKEARTRGPEHKPVNLARVAREAAAAMLPLVEDAGRSLEIDAPEQLMVKGSRDDLGDMLRNLLDNALTHGKGRILLRVAQETGTPQARALIDVADEGPGVREDLKADLFDRFRKGTASSAGAGLGLAIVREVVLAHGGEARFLPGAECVVRVALPVAA